MRLSRYQLRSKTSHSRASSPLLCMLYVYMYIGVLSQIRYDIGYFIFVFVYRPAVAARTELDNTFEYTRIEFYCTKSHKSKKSILVVLSQCKLFISLTDSYLFRPKQRFNVRCSRTWGIKARMHVQRGPASKCRVHLKRVQGTTAVFLCRFPGDLLIRIRNISYACVQAANHLLVKKEKSPKFRKDECGLSRKSTATI